MPTFSTNPLTGPHRPLRIGLTGGIASGKSTVARLFAALGIPVLDTDVIAREVTAPGAPVLARIAARFGAVLTPAGELDRRALRHIVFADSQARADLESLLHPLILERLEQLSAAAGGPYQLLVLPLLVEGHHAQQVDRVLVVDCEQARQIARLQARDGSTLEEARAILDAQVSRAQRLAAADDVITNDADITALRDRVETLHAAYLALARQRATQSPH